MLLNCAVKVQMFAGRPFWGRKTNATDAVCGKLTDIKNRHPESEWRFLLNQKAVIKRLSWEQRVPSWER
jgi:hypothetical protein